MNWLFNVDHFFFFLSAFSFKSVCVNAPWHGMLSQRSASPALNFQMISSFNKESEFHWLFSVWCVCYDVLSERLNLEGGEKKALLRLPVTHPLYVFAGHLS